MTGAEIAAALAPDGGVVALVTETRGSAPRAAGAAMVVTATDARGTIGGGAVEHRVIAHARAMLAGGEARATLDFPLGPALDQCCGGRMTVALALVAAADAPRFARGAAALWPDGPVFRDPPAPRPVFVYGAGHVGAALVRALAPLPFAVRWIDARAGFTAGAPPGVSPVETPLPEAEAAAAPREALHLVLTHSHALDLEIVAAALARGTAFVGLIGSATKRATFARKLRARGLDPACLTCPIGLPGLHDKRPAVIAASVAAQMLLVDAAEATRSSAA
ncbi:MAG: xanthine dehydrogenase accessory protein XdhC [Rhodobacteraceae bacterium]|nr:MAG: xanthine dehydrogenase accessory protein XdhC [Paracoccaceae bacterium]